MQHTKTSFSWRAFLTILIAVIILVIGCWAVLLATGREINITWKSVEIQIKQASDDPIADELEKTGFVFHDSDERLLTDADILALTESTTYTRDELLRFSINEIYARNHYSFQSELYLTFYSQFDWYLGGMTAEQAVLQFNDNERKNVDFLVKIEKGLTP